ncbi:MAG: rane-fusion protein [Betaproteobacteria bacterium]|jgi:cobalt-zinc-cadmium efflux system membrane fusion protein|nr:rane-fusion protein [Betaproteobacteria bacterium]MEA3157477.1 rane fusion protein heavy metal efflux system [Betaproteobacteria bacterium]
MHVRKTILTVCAGAILFGGGYALYRYASGSSDHAPANELPATATEPGVVRYPRGSPQLQFIATQGVVLLPEPLLEPLNGRVAYDENYTSRVAAPISGRVIKIEVQPGDKVKAGQPLAWLDAPEYAAAVADVQKNDNDVRLKTRAYQRAKEMVDAEVLARKDYEAAETDLKQAQAELHRAQLKLRNLNSGSQTARDDGRFAVRAPISGVIADRQVNPGGEVRPDAQNPLFVITDPTRVWVMIDLPERYLGKVAVGQIVSVEVDAYKGIDLNGRIASIGQVLDAATRRVQVRSVVENQRQLLKPEMFARVTPLSEERQKRARIPNSALVSEGLYSFVFVEKEPGVFEKRKLELGLQGRDESYVKSGLSEGEKIVASGALLLQSELASRH